MPGRLVRGLDVREVADGLAAGPRASGQELGRIQGSGEPFWHPGCFQTARVFFGYGDQHGRLSGLAVGRGSFPMRRGCPGGGGDELPETSRTLRVRLPKFVYGCFSPRAWRLSNRVPWRINGATPATGWDLRQCSNSSAGAHFVSFCRWSTVRMSGSLSTRVGRRRGRRRCP